MMKDALSILDPTTEDDFFQNYFEKNVLFISRDNPNYFDEIITLQDIEGVIDSGHLYYPHINLKKTGGETALQPWLEDTLKKPTLEVSQTELYKQVADGQTLIINSIEKFLPKMNHFIVTQSKNWGISHSANTYITPPNNQGFNWHYDNHDVFILQIKGNKTWNLKEEDPLLPDSNFKSKSPQIEDPEHSTEVVLKEGDSLYIPRGVYHIAKTEDEASIHVTLAIYSVKAYRLFDQFIEEARKKKTFRRSIVANNASKLDKEEVLATAKKFAIDYFSKLDLETTDKYWDQSVTFKVPPSNKNRLSSILKINTLKIDSQVRVNPNIALDISSNQKFIEIRANGKKLKYPIFMQKAITQLLSSKPILLKELTANIPEKHAIDLAKKFIVEGFIILEF